MPQYPSRWRVNSSVLYEAVRDEIRSSIAASLARTDDSSGTDSLAAVRHLRTVLYSVDGFDRAEVTALLKVSRSREIPISPEHPHG